MSSTPAKEFDGNVSGLIRHLLFDSIILALTSFIVGVPAANTIYNYLGSVLGSFPRVRCYPPASNISASTMEDIEFFCLSHFSLYATFYPALATVFGVLINVFFFIWINYHSDMFDLFYSWAKKIELASDSQQNLKIIKTIKDVIGEGNSMYISYVVVKFLQAFITLIAFVVTLVLLCVLPFDPYHPFQYDLTFHCQVNQFEFLSSLLMFSQVPCTAINQYITIEILFVNLFLLLLVLLCSILSMFPKLPLLAHNLKLFKSEENAALFSFHTGLSHRLSKELVLTDRKKIRSNLEFLKVFLLRTNSELANKIFDVQVLDKLEVDNDEELLMSIDYWQHNFVGPRTGPFQFPEDLKNEGFENILEAQRHSHVYDSGKALELKQPPKKFRAAVLRYCSPAAGNPSNAVYITSDPTFLGIPLALTFIFKNVYIVSFDPDRTVEGSTLTADNLCYKKKHSDNLKQLIFPHDILTSDPSNWSTIIDNSEAKILRSIHCIVCGPIKKALSWIQTLQLMLDSVIKPAPRECILLTIAPVTRADEQKYITKDTLKSTKDGDFVPNWKIVNVYKARRESDYLWNWVDKDNCGTSLRVIEEEGNMFTFDLFQISV